MLIVPGSYHWIELVQKRLVAQWEHFEEIRPGLESACYIFHNQFTRDPFVWSFVHGREPWRIHFESGPKLYEGGRE